MPGGYAATLSADTRPTASSALTTSASANHASRTVIARGPAGGGLEMERCAVDPIGRRSNASAKSSASGATPAPMIATRTSSVDSSR